ncbi:MAG: LUD domain-containing protein [Thermoleophilia bacterium]
MVKSKSMVSEEVHLNAALEEHGIEVVETDLGERIIQLAGERPSHLIVPAVHKTKEEIIELFSETMGIEDPPTDPEDLTRLVRDDLRPRFKTADMGITGANFVLADSGTLVIVENEGNGRLSSQLPPLHVAITGIEKIIPSLKELPPFLELLPRSGTGQLLTAYVSLITGTPSTDVVDFGRANGGQVAEREFHLVLVDNGRSAAREDAELREALYCIRCGACLNACAPYTQVGGHVYGVDPYPGGIGCAWNWITKGPDAAKEINALCTTCSRCTEVCPVQIDIPWLNTTIKARNNQRLGVGLRERIFARADLLGDLSSPLAPVVNAALKTPLARLPLKWIGVDTSRKMPDYARRTFEQWFRERGEVVVREPGRKAALFVDCFINHNKPWVGRAAVEVLERAGVQLELACNECCGRAAMSQGLLEEPRRWARANVERLSKLVDEGREILFIEPSCLSSVRDDYRRLLEHEGEARLAEIEKIERHSWDVTEFFLHLVQEEKLDLHLKPVPGTYVVHGHCHQKSLGIGSVPGDALRLIPQAAVIDVEALCCGLVGSFGYKQEFSELSRAIGSRLFEKLSAHEGVVVASGISCQSQIGEGTGRSPKHPMEVLVQAFG